MRFVLAVLYLVLACSELRADDKKSNPTAALHVRGYARDEQGRPLSGAEIHLAECFFETRRLAQTTAGPNGEYEFVDVSIPLHDQMGSFQLFGFADDRGFAWHPQSRYFAIDKPDDFEVGVVGRHPAYFQDHETRIDLIFPQAATLAGRVVDDQGKPIAGAKLQVRYADRNIDQTDYSLLGKVGNLIVLNHTGVVPPEITQRETDANGVFKFSGLPSNCRFRTSVRLPGGLERWVWMATRDGLKADKNGTPVYSDGVDIVFPGTYRIPMRVTFGDSGRPAEKVRVGVGASESYAAGATNSDGVLELSLPTGQYSVELLPRIGTPYRVTNASLTVTDQPIEKNVDFKLDPAAVVEVTVTDAKTGKALKGVDLWVAKDGARSLHFFRSYEVETRICHVERPQTDAEGRLTALFPPGTHQIGIALDAWPKGYRAVEPVQSEVDCRAGETTRIKFQMTRDAASP